MKARAKTEQKQVQGHRTSAPRTASHCQQSAQDGDNPDPGRVFSGKLIHRQGSGNVWIQGTTNRVPELVVKSRTGFSFRTPVSGALIHHLSSLITLAPEIAPDSGTTFNRGNFIPPFWKNDPPLTPTPGGTRKQTFARIQATDQGYRFNGFTLSVFSPHLVRNASFVDFGSHGVIFTCCYLFSCDGQQREGEVICPSKAGRQKLNERTEI